MHRYSYLILRKTMDAEHRSISSYHSGLPAQGRAPGPHPKFALGPTTSADFRFARKKNKVDRIRESVHPRGLLADKKPIQNARPKRSLRS